MMYEKFPKELCDYISKVEKEPWRFPFDTCIQKTLKVARKAQELGLRSEIIFCFALTPKWLRWIYPYNPHLYPVIEGIKVDLFYAKSWTDRVTRGNWRIFTLNPKP